MAVKRLHRHSHSTINNGLNFRRPTADPNVPSAQLPTLHKNTHIISIPDSSDFEPVSFSDADWEANINTIRSFSETALFLEGEPINYKCKLQHSVALSSTESELYATCEAAKNVKKHRSVMSHLGFNLSKSTTIYEDNATTISVANNERATKRLRCVRHFEILVWFKTGDVV